MRRYARFSEDYINESLENYDNLEAAAEELAEAYFDYCDKQMEIVESYDLDETDLDEVADILNSSDMVEALTVRRAPKKHTFNVRKKGGKFEGKTITRNYTKRCPVFITSDGKNWDVLTTDTWNTTWGKDYEKEFGDAETRAEKRSDRAKAGARTRQTRKNIPFSGAGFNAG